MRKLLEDLVFIGAAEDTVTLFGKLWKLRTLTSEEHLEATSVTGNYETYSRIYALKMEILSRSLIEVDNIPLLDKNETSEFVKKLQPPVVNKLYDEYEKILKKQDDSLKDLNELKNS